MQIGCTPPKGEDTKATMQVRVINVVEAAEWWYAVGFGKHYEMVI